MDQLKEDLALSSSEEEVLMLEDKALQAELDVSTKCCDYVSPF